MHVIKKLKRIVVFFRRSSVAARELADVQKKNIEGENLRKKARQEAGGSEGGTGAANTESDRPKEVLRLILEVRTRWNSLLHMIRRYVILNKHDYVDRALLKVARDNSSKAKPPPPLTPKEVEMLEEVESVLLPLDAATVEMSAEKAVTISKIITVVDSITTVSNIFRVRAGTSWCRDLVTIDESVPLFEGG